MGSKQPFLFPLKALLPFILCTSLNCNSETNTDGVDLLHFKSKIFRDPQGILNSWNDSLHFCQWQGVTCSPTQGRVTAIDLRFRGLQGYLSPYSGNLSLLREIWLGNNTLQGHIPPEIGRLSSLQILSLNNNSLQGQIPANLSHCSNLVYLALDVNMLVGNIPQELSSLINLKKLLIHNNSLTGGIPPFIGNLTSLETFNAAGNAFGGTIPEALGQLKNLTDLLLGSNKLHGTIPPFIYNLSSLRVLSLLENQIHGSLPPGLLFTLPRLQVLQLQLNEFTGPLPFSLSNASFLEKIDLMYNNFSGKISANFGGLLHLKRLTLGFNNLGSGETDDLDFIASLANCSTLEVLSLGYNNLRATLPNYIGNLSTQLSILGLSANHFYGDIPSSITSLVNLSILFSGGNQLTGMIPSNIGHLRKLQKFYLDSNVLSSKIPSSIGNLSLLSQLRLDNNRLQGTIPSVFENLQNLILLNLSLNNLSGTIPKQLFSISTLSISLNLARNHLLGSLPTEVGYLKNLGELDLSENKLVGEVPSSLGSCISLERLSLEGNFFGGPIPVSLKFLRGILSIDLSHNNLSGPIPQYLEELPLNKLNLSFNNLEGSVPTRGVFADASTISIAGNNRLCGGISELELPRCKFKTSKKIIIIISIVAAVIGAIFVYLIMVYCFKNREITGEGPSISIFERSFLTVSYGMLFKATDGFCKDNLIGVGGFGYIFKGKLDPDGAVVAIKVLNLSQDHHQRASKSFVTECETVRNIRHRNLVKVISCCSSVDFQGKDFKALVFEFMPNGSLDRWLHPEAENNDIGEHQTLTLVQRVNIAIDVACALNYLHHHCQRPIVHCNLKPSNVLLDYEMTAHVGDFGLARFLLETGNLNNDSSIGVRGTIGYVAPEYGVGSKISREGDVYSYGILLLEMMTGKRPTDSMFDRGFNLHKYAQMALPEQVNEILDPKLVKNIQETAFAWVWALDYVISAVMKIGVDCSMSTPKDRMSMSDVVSKLNLVRDIIQGTQSRVGLLL